ERQKTERATPVRWDACAVLAQESHRARDVATPLLHLLVQRRAQDFRFLDLRGCLAAIQVRSERDEASLREPVAGLAKWLCQPPPLVQHNDAWPAAALRRRQIARRGCSVRVEFDHPSSHLILLFSSHGYHQARVIRPF